MYQKLLSIGYIALEPLTPLQPPYPNWYKPDLTCEYHASVVGHNIHACSAFKKRLMHLIKAGWITFEGTPNVSSNPLINHTSRSASVNAPETSKHRWLEQGVKKAVCTLEDRGQSSAIEWEDMAFQLLPFTWSCLFQPVLVLLAIWLIILQDSISNEPFLLIKSCVFLCSCK